MLVVQPTINRGLQRLEIAYGLAASHRANVAPNTIGTSTVRDRHGGHIEIRRNVGISLNGTRGIRRAAVDVLVDESHGAVTHHAVNAASVAAAGSNDGTSTTTEN